jgi:hypothetical protein
MSTRRASFCPFLTHPRIVFFFFFKFPPQPAWIKWRTGRRSSIHGARPNHQLIGPYKATNGRESNRQGYSHRLNIPVNARKSRTRVVANLQVFFRRFCRRRSKLINTKARPLRLVATVVHLATGPSLRLPLSPKGKRCVLEREKILTRFPLKHRCVNQTLLNLEVARASQTDIGLITRRSWRIQG